MDNLYCGWYTTGLSVRWRTGNINHNMLWISASRQRPDNLKDGGDIIPPEPRSFTALVQLTTHRASGYDQRLPAIFS